MEKVKQAEKIMKALIVITTLICTAGVVGYILTGKGSHLGVLAGWATFLALMYSQAHRAIKALKQEIESLKSGGSEN